MTNKKTGCEVLSELWNVALDCQVDRPGITGTPNRLYGIVECSNVRHFMSMATMRCWQEMNQNGNRVEFPPLFQDDTQYKTSNTKNDNNNHSGNKTH